METILGELGLGKKPRLTVLNKIDLMLDESLPWDEESALAYFAAQDVVAGDDIVPVAAVKGWGLARLLELIGQVMKPAEQTT